MTNFIIPSDVSLSREFRVVRFIAAAYLSLMSVQLIGIEGYETSFIKVAAMLFMALVMLYCGLQFTKAVLWGALYLMTLSVSIIFNIDSFRFETVVYRFAAVLAFICFYNLVSRRDIFTIDYFYTLVRGIIIAYTIVIVIQQLLSLMGINNMLIFNQAVSIVKFGRPNSLACEPSHAARIMGAAFIVLLRLLQCLWGKDQVTIKRLCKNERILILCYLFTMLTMQSGTAMMILVITSLFFIRKRFVIVVIILFVALWSAIPLIPYQPLHRAYNTLNAAVSLDREAIQEADLSASARVLPYVYTIENFDLTEEETWIGQGIDTGQKADKWGTKQMIGGMSDYGFMQYIFSLCLVFACCISRPISIETLFFLVVLMAEIRNVYVWWAILMMFATTKYFLLQSELKAQNERTCFY